jgi:hypothetical protein
MASTPTAITVLVRGAAAAAFLACGFLAVYWWQFCSGIEKRCGAEMFGEFMDGVGWFIVVCTFVIPLALISLLKIGTELLKRYRR